MSKPRILIIEDEEIIAVDIEEALLSMNYNVVGKGVSGEEALRLAQSTRPDLVLMDIQLEGPMDGIEAAGKIREQFQLPVVFLTAFADKPTLDRAKILEPYGYVLKPFRQAELRTVIELALHRHSIDKTRQTPPDAVSPGARPAAPLDLKTVPKPSTPPSPAMQATIKSFLGSLRPFSDLGDEVLSLISPLCMITSYRSNETIVHEGEERKTGFLVMGGRAAVFKTSPGGKELIVELLGPTDLFGILAVMERAPFPFSARAQGTTRILWVPREVIFHITECYPEISRELFHRVLERLRKAHDLSRALAHDKVEIRVASALLAVVSNFAERAEDNESVMEIEMTRQELGELVGTTPETISRILNRMESDGIVDLSQAGKVRIMQRGELSRMMS